MGSLEAIIWQKVKACVNGLSPVFSQAIAFASESR